MSKCTYYRSQIIPGDTHTRVYWSVSLVERLVDVLEEDIPDGEVVYDVTYPTEVVPLLKNGSFFEPVLGVQKDERKESEVD